VTSLWFTCLVFTFKPYLPFGFEVILLPAAGSLPFEIRAFFFNISRVILPLPLFVPINLQDPGYGIMKMEIPGEKKSTSTEMKKVFQLNMIHRVQ
jgi:hypothetical protein